MTGGLAKSGAKNGSNAASSTCTVRSMGSKIPASLKNVATSGQAKVITSGQSMKHPINGQLMDVTAMGSLKSAAVKVRQEMSKQISESESSDDYSDVPVPDGLIRCVYCKRNFAEERVEKHQVICQKTKTKKRKIYDASKKRVQGTEAETYLKKPITSVRAIPKGPPKPSNWRSKHEDFIKTIRAAKEMQVHLAKGGKLSDLPPPPPSENLDYVKCPHCMRRFNESAAARHIPLCKNMQHNKPKPKTIVPAVKSSSVKRR